MKCFRMSVISFLFTCLVTSLTGCAGLPLDISSTHNVLTNGESLTKGKKTAVNVFKLEDNIIFYVYVNMTDPTQKYGSHSVIWNWYRDNELVSRGSKKINFNSSPTELWSHRNATALGTGHFKVETIVDNQIVGTTEFDIK